MHIEIREKNGSKKYYLAHSFRDADSVKKVRVFLGRDLTNEALLLRKKSAEAELKQRVKKAKAINSPFFTVLSPIELKELATLEVRGGMRVRHLSRSLIGPSSRKPSGLGHKRHQRFSRRRQRSEKYFWKTKVGLKIKAKKISLKPSGWQMQLTIYDQQTSTVSLKLIQRTSISQSSRIQNILQEISAKKV